MIAQKSTATTLYLAIPTALARRRSAGWRVPSERTDSDRLFKLAGGRPALAVMLLLLMANILPATVIPFTLLPPSGVDINNLSITASNDGTLVGDYEPTSNPTGTRTKPGLFGPFGSTENVPVPTRLTVGVTGSPDVPTVGGFDLQVDLTNLTLEFSNYAANMPTGTTANLNLTVGFGTNGFRTRQPTSVYLPGTVNIPFGSATLTSLGLVQAGPAAPGVLVPTGPTTYDFNGLVPVLIQGEVEALGNTISIPGFPAVLPLTGTLDLTGPEAILLATADLDGMQTVNPNLALPPFTLPVPTILPPGDTANLVFELTLEEISAAFSGRVTTNARGPFVPEPSSLTLVLVLGLMWAGRHR